MRALTVQQPWAWCILWAGKGIENRTWFTSYRGPLAIHAGVRVDPFGMESPLYLEALARATSAARQRLGERGILGFVDLVGIHPNGPGCCDSEWAVREPGAYHWQVEDPRPLTEPVPCRGALQLWSPPREVQRAVKAAA